MKTKKQGIVNYVISPILIFIFLLVVYAIKGIYPFGGRSIAYYDMPQSMIPLYYHTWDVLHGNKSLVWDWYSGMGGSMADTMGNFTLNPFNLFFLLIERESISEFMSFFLVIKLMLAAFAMSFYTVKSHKEDVTLMPVLAGITYASCGFMIQYYTNIQFLDIAALFPLIVYALDCLINQKQYSKYIVFMTIGFMTNLYLMYMVCIYIILKLFLGMSETTKKERRKCSARIGIATFSSLGLSAFSWIPMVCVLMSSQRAGTQAASTGYIGTLVYVVCELAGQKHFMLYGCEWVFSLMVLIVLKGKSSIHGYRNRLFIVVLLVLPVFLENINVLWHMGGYAHFPMRFGYILTFEAICMFMDVFLKTEYCEHHELKLHNRILGYLAIAFTVVCDIIIAFYDIGFKEYGIRDLDMYKGYWAVCCLVSVTIFLAFLSKSKITVICSISFIILSQVWFGLYSFIGPDKEYFSECDYDLLERAVNLESYGDLKTPVTDRAKNIDNSMITNYPFITERAAISNWTWGANARLRDAQTALGYSISYTRLLDNGGTVFSDALWGMKYVISGGKVNERLYKKENENEYLYNIIDGLPFAFLCPSKLNIDYMDNKYENHNHLFSEISGYPEKLIEYYDISEFDSEIDRGEGCVVSLHIPIDKESTVYVYTDSMDWGFAIEENGCIKTLPYQTNVDNVIYPAPFQNGIIECGTYDESIILRIIIPAQFYVSNEQIRENIHIGVMDMNLLREGYGQIKSRQNLSVNNGKRSMSISGEIYGDGYLYVPIGYNTGWKAYVNGTFTNIEPGLNGSVVMIPVHEGKILVELKYSQNGLISGILIGIFVFGIIVTFVVLDKNRLYISKIELLLGKFAYPLLFIISWGVFVYMYVLPFLAYVFLMFYSAVSVT